MKKISALVLTCMILAGLGKTVYAAQETAEQNGNMNTEAETQASELECKFSEPQIVKKASHVEYKTTVTVTGPDLVEGYEIHVNAERKDDIVIENKAGGNATENVFKDGVMYLAVMSGELTGEEIELCEITVKLPYGGERVLEVPEIQIVTSVAAEEIEKTGPYEIELPEVKAPFYASVWFYLAIAAVIAAAAGCIVWKKKKGMQKK